MSCIHILTSTTKASLNIINKREMSSSMSYQSVENIGPSLKFILYLCVFVSVYSNLYTMFKHVQCLESSCPVTSSYLGEGQNRRIFNDALWRVCLYYSRSSSSLAIHIKLSVPFVMKRILAFLTILRYKWQIFDADWLFRLRPLFVLEKP